MSASVAIQYKIEGGLVAYFAGLVDAEGYLGIRRKKQGTRPCFCECAQVSMTDRVAVAMLHEHFGGTFRSQYPNPYPDGIQSHKTRFVWSVECHKAVEFVNTIMPFIHIKRQSALLLLDLHQSKLDEAQLPKQGVCRKMSDDVLMYRQRLYENICKINTYGVEEDANWRDMFSNLTDTKLAYIAGYIDGDGYVGIVRNDSMMRHGLQNDIQYTGRVQVTSTSHSLLEALQAKFGGFNTPHKSNYPDPRIVHARPRYVWAINALYAFHFLQLIIPFLKIKRMEAEAVLRLQETKLTRGSPVPDAVLKEREHLFEMCRKRVEICTVTARNLFY